MTLGAELDLASPQGERTLSVDDFFTADGIWNTVRERDEIVARVRVPIPALGLHTSFQKLRERQSVDFPLLNLALAVEFEEDGQTVKSIALVVAALGAKPRRIGRLDELAVGEKLTADLIEEIGRQAHRQCHPLENIIVEIEWRRAMVPVYVRRAFGEIANQ
jgi:CO/xanthine dehydrogenase FAD-binding subunit